MRSIALGLDLEEHFFDSKIDAQCHNLRLLSYPPIQRKKLDGEGQARAGAHSGLSLQVYSPFNSLMVLFVATDYGTLTLLFQDQVGGLEVQDPHTGIYHAATPIVRPIWFLIRASSHFITLAAWNDRH